MATTDGSHESNDGDALRAVQGVSVGDPTGGAATIAASVVVAIWSAAKAIGRGITGRARRERGADQ
jgi:hypothetical protein